MEYSRCKKCHGKMYKVKDKKWRHVFEWDENDHIGDPSELL